MHLPLLLLAPDPHDHGIHRRPEDDQYPPQIINPGGNGEDNRHYRQPNPRSNQNSCIRHLDPHFSLPSLLTAPPATPPDHPPPHRSSPAGSHSPINPAATGRHSPTGSM